MSTYYNSDRTLTNLTDVVIDDLSVENTITVNNIDIIGDLKINGSQLTSDNIPEGVVNQYFTLSRARNAISVLTSTAISMSYNISTGVISSFIRIPLNLFNTVSQGVIKILPSSGTTTQYQDIEISNNNTTRPEIILRCQNNNSSSSNFEIWKKPNGNINNIATKRFEINDNGIDVIGGYSVNGSLLSTSNIIEGTNLYYTDTRARNSISVNNTNSKIILNYVPSTGILSANHNLLTTDITEGTNLYYTSTRCKTDASNLPNSLTVNGDVNITGGYRVNGNIMKSIANTLSSTNIITIIDGNNNLISALNVPVRLGTGFNQPTFNTASPGTKIILYPFISSTSTDYAMGIENNSIWTTLPSVNSDYKWKLYGGVTEVFNIDGSGQVRAKNITFTDGNNVSNSSLNRYYQNTESYSLFHSYSSISGISSNPSGVVSWQIIGNTCHLNMYAKFNISSSWTTTIYNFDDLQLRNIPIPFYNSALMPNISTVTPIYTGSGFLSIFSNTIISAYVYIYFLNSSLYLQIQGGDNIARNYTQFSLNISYPHNAAIL